MDLPGWISLSSSALTPSQENKKHFLVVASGVKRQAYMLPITKQEIKKHILTCGSNPLKHPVRAEVTLA